jgi:diguanylate cyclase (GGDEF)-like protein
MDGLKQINDTYGHMEGDHAIITVASILKKTFREDDIIARIGGDEFAVLAVVRGRTAEQSIMDRLERNLVTSGTAAGYTISVSHGLAAMEVGDAADFDALMQQADGSLYDHKRRRTRSTEPGRGPKLQEDPTV